MFVGDMTRNKCFFLRIRISHILRFISICDLFTDFRLYIVLAKLSDGSQY
jgi:hypothetical protein